MSESDSVTAQNKSEIVDLGEQQEIFKILECPICYEIPFPPITCCSTGHPICQHCRSKCLDCPLCRQPFSQSRNFVMESLVLNARHSCPNKRLGCSIVLNGELMQTHKLNCDFRPTKISPLISCQFGKRDNCGNSRIPLTEYLVHLKSIHGVVERTGTSNWVEEYKIRGNVSEPQWVYTYKEMNGTVFFSRVFTVDSLIHWSIAIADSEEQARKFMATIIIDSTKPETRLRMQWTIPVHSIKWSNDQVRLNGMCAVCPLNFMDHFMSIQSNLSPNGVIEQSRRFQTIFQVQKLG